MEEKSLIDQPHRRFNILTRSWVLCSPHRAKRPWLGQVEKPSTDKPTTFDPNCYLCPGNTRASGDKNDDYKSTYVFTNDYSALLPKFIESESQSFNENDLFIAEPERGICKVIIFSPDHSKTLPVMSSDEIKVVIDTWCDEYIKISKEEFINYIQIFENKGAIMGCSNPHPHCQIWATEAVPHEVQLEVDSFKKWNHDKKTCLLCSYLEAEIKKNVRIISMNESFVTLVPYWAVWPFETVILPIQHISSLNEMTLKQKIDLASSLKEITTRYDNIFSCSFPYSMGIHQSPCKQECKEFHFHIHFYPPLLRSSSVKKFFVGFEMLGEPQRDITAEKACQIIQSTSKTHYSEQVQK